MNFWETAVRRVEKKYKVVYKRGPSTVAMFFAGIALASWALFALLSGYPAVQYIYYTFRPSTSTTLATELKDVKVEPAQIVKAEEQVGGTVLPPVDSNLPDGHYLEIPSIGVDTTIWEAPTAEYETAFRKGVWRVPEMAEPPTGSPVILSAHRFGYLEWTNDYRIKNSFFKLPQLNEGDEFEILWDQRHYKYKVTKKSEGAEIDDYAHDVILYTCKFLVSSTRIFIYADLVK